MLARALAVCFAALVPGAAACSTEPEALPASTVRVETPSGSATISVDACGLDEGAGVVFLVASGDGTGVQFLVELDDEGVAEPSRAGLTITTAEGTLGSGEASLIQSPVAGALDVARVDGDHITVEGEGVAVEGEPEAGPVSVRARCEPEGFA